MLTLKRWQNTNLCRALYKRATSCRKSAPCMKCSQTETTRPCRTWRSDHPHLIRGFVGPANTRKYRRSLGAARLRRTIFGRRVLFTSVRDRDSQDAPPLLRRPPHGPPRISVELFRVCGTSRLPFPLGSIRVFLSAGRLGRRCLRERLGHRCASSSPQSPKLPPACVSSTRSRCSPNDRVIDLVGP